MIVHCFNCKECDKKVVCRYSQDMNDLYNKIITLYEKESFQSQFMKIKIDCTEYKPRQNLTFR